MSIPWTQSTEEFDNLWGADGVPMSPHVPDILETMFAQQREQFEKYAKLRPTKYVSPKLWGQIDRQDVQAEINLNFADVVKELGEAMNHLKNHRWKQTLKPVADHSAFYEELADVWHFFIQLNIAAGVTPTDVFKQYFSKALENERRRENAY